MLKRLRRKFILTNTVYVGIVLFVVFGLVCFLTHSERRDSLTAMLRASLAPESGAAFRLGEDEYAPGEASVPHCVIVLADGEEAPRVIGRGGASAIEGDILSSALARALAGEDDAGDAGGGLYYVKAIYGGETRVALADDGYIRAATQNLAKTLSLVYVCATALVVIVSTLVAKIALLSTENAWEQQKRFIADASHALKTPLTVILANIGILKGGRFGGDEENLHWLSSTEEEARAMHQLIDEMLVLAQSDLNVKRAEFTQVNLSNLITGLALQFEALAFDKGISMETRVQGGVELRGSEKALSQMAAALIENAFKYEKPGGAVRIALEKQVRRTVFSVYNASTCILPEEKERIFDRFCRVKSAQNAAREGHGLGLSIARSVAEAHDAVIDVESSPENGTEFRVTFRHIL